MSFYGDRAAAALRLIKKRGTTMPMVTRTPGVLNPALDTMTGAQTTTATVNAVILPSKERESYSFEQNMEVLRDERVLYVAGATCPVAEIRPDTTFTFEGSVWTARGSSAIKPDGVTSVLHIVIVRR